MDQDFLSMTKFIGQKIPFWVQGPGGNTSVKVNQNSPSLMYIKSTGLRLDEVSEQKGLSLINLEILMRKYTDTFLNTATEDQYAMLIKQKENLNFFQNAYNMPSMETGFHVSLDSKYVLHFHSLVTQMIFKELDLNPRRVENWFKEKTKLKVKFFNFYYPGLKLSQALHSSESGQTQAQVYFLKNHGVILNVDSKVEFEDYINLEKDFSTDFGYMDLYSYFNKSFKDILAEFKIFEMPFKNYFPDTLVFKQEILNKILDFNSQTQMYKLKKDINVDDVNLTEIWLATLILYKSDSELESIDDQHEANLKDLPTEKNRKLEHSKVKG